MINPFMELNMCDFETHLRLGRRNDISTSYAKRIVNCFRRLGINKVGEILTLDRKALKNIEGLSPKSLKLVMSILELWRGE